MDVTQWLGRWGPWCPDQASCGSWLPSSWAFASRDVWECCGQFPSMTSSFENHFPQRVTSEQDLWGERQRRVHAEGSAFWLPLWAPSISYPDYCSLLGLPFKCHTGKAWSQGCCFWKPPQRSQRNPSPGRTLRSEHTGGLPHCIPREHLFSKPPRWGMSAPH